MLIGSNDNFAQQTSSLKRAARLLAATDFRGPQTSLECPVERLALPLPAPSRHAVGVVVRAIDSQFDLIGQSSLVPIECMSIDHRLNLGRSIVLVKLRWPNERPVELETHQWVRVVVVVVLFMCYVSLIAQSAHQTINNFTFRSHCSAALRLAELARLELAHNQTRWAGA